ncbi:MAG TPA: hypothetical protein VIG64_14115 [Actinomycetota bacterium]|jgi:hypothetical protein
MADVSQFDTPGSLRDMPDGAPFYRAWHKLVAGKIKSLTGGSGDGEFFDPSQWDFEVVAQRTLVWMGFPRTLLVSEHRDDKHAAFANGEERRSEQTAQDEYLEWHVTRRKKKITKVEFVTELPEYYRTLARTNEGRARVVELYRERLGKPVPEDDLFNGRAYQGQSRWNTSEGIVHFIQKINTLDDALGLAQGSVDSKGALDNYDIDVKQKTSADPRVALDIGVLARKGLSVTFAQPIGLYMIHWDDTGWTKPDGTPVGDYWRVTRGVPGKALRLEYEVPAEQGFVVGDIRIGGRPIEFGGHIAEHVTVAAVGVAGRRRR